ncbi:hypothetical protein V6N13_038391 [Hibiscus sabdariffa]
MISGEVRIGIFLNLLFPRGEKRSKILFTTRNKDVALHADPCNSPIEVPFLTNDQSWKLFIRKAFPRNKTDPHACPKAFEKLGREMVKKCGGLPLAIVVLGGLLATKRTQGTNVRTCRIHDLLRDLCIEKAREDNFLEIVMPPSTESRVILAEPMLRRIAIHTSERVLSVGRLDAGKWYLSSEIGNLYLLRYLKLCGDRIILPRTIGRLKSLHTLYLVCHGYVEIPNVVSKLERLRHIVMHTMSSMGNGACFGLRFLPKNVETLKCIVVDENIALAGLSNLQSLGMIFMGAQDAKPILISLRELQRLSKLRLQGQIKEDPQGSHHVLKFLPPGIVKLTLRGCKMKQDPMGVLEKLPCLRVLILQVNAYEGSKMICSASGFPQLDYLRMECLYELEEWEIEEGAMPHLWSLCLRRISKLKIIPEGLKCVATLQQLELRQMETSFNRRIENKDGDEGEDFYKVVIGALRCTWPGFAAA